MKLEGAVLDAQDVVSYIQTEGDYYAQALSALKSQVPEDHILGSIRRIEN